MFSLDYAVTCKILIEGAIMVPTQIIRRCLPFKVFCVVARSGDANITQAQIFDQIINLMNLNRDNKDILKDRLIWLRFTRKTEANIRNLTYYITSYHLWDLPCTFTMLSREHDCMCSNSQSSVIWFVSSIQTCLLTEYNKLTYRNMFTFFSNLSTDDSTWQASYSVAFTVYLYVYNIILDLCRTV